MQDAASKIPLRLIRPAKVRVANIPALVGITHNLHRHIDLRIERTAAGRADAQPVITPGPGYERINHLVKLLALTAESQSVHRAIKAGLGATVFLLQWNHLASAGQPIQQDFTCLHGLRDRQHGLFLLGNPRIVQAF